MKVFVYWNLHRKCWSVKALEGPFKGRVFTHAREIDLGYVRFKVSEAGRQRVLREGKKNVHAGAVGQLERWVDLNNDSRRFKNLTQVELAIGKKNRNEVRYNPRTGSTFVDSITNAVVTWSEAVHFLPNRSVCAYGA
jgi:hypothetical protein